MKIIECPRDAMQGIIQFIPTETKSAYINTLLKVGFDTIDFGSFVSPKAIPQLADTVLVLKKLDLTTTTSKLLAIVANVRGAQEASAFEQIHYLGFPFSISETFQKLNTNSTIDQSLINVEQIQNICISANKKLVLYLSMAFGNPYGDKWNIEIAEKWIHKLSSLEIKIIALADTIGSSTPENISYLFKNLIPAYPKIELGAHLHTLPSSSKEKVDAALESGCKRFDSTIGGYGGCPMAKNELVGNLSTENLINYLKEKNIKIELDLNMLQNAIKQSLNVFPESL